MEFSALSKHLETREEISMAFVFGSMAEGFAGRESDLDIAIYFKPGQDDIQEEMFARHPAEDEIWFSLERLTGKAVDLLVLNRAPATIVDTILREGKPLLIRDRRIYLNLLLRVSREAEDYREFVEDFWKTKYA